MASTSINARSEPFDLYWCQRRRLPTASLVRLLHERAIGLRREGSNFIKGSREFYYSISIRHAVHSVERPQFFPLRFTPDGSILVGIHLNFQEILLFTYRGCQFGARHSPQHLFNAIFPKCRHVHFWNPRENPRSPERAQFGTLSRECAFITPDSHFLIVSASIPVPGNRSIFSGIVRNNESLEPDVHLLNISFYSIDMKKAQVVDKQKFEFDEINIQTGVYMLGWTMAILSVQHQTIYMLGIDKQSGQFIPFKQIGPSVLDDDQLWLGGSASSTNNFDQTFTAFRQRFLTFLYKENSKRGQIKQFLYGMNIYRNLKMQKIQFVGPDILLIRMDIHPRKADFLSGQHYMFVLFEWRLGQIVGVYERDSEILFDKFIRFNECFKNGHLVSNNFPTSMEHCGPLRKQHDQCMHEQRELNAPESQIRRRLLNFLPTPNTQHFVTSPYLDPVLFSFDEQLLTYLQMGRFPVDQSLKLFSRRTKNLHTNLEFHDNTPRSIAYNSCDARVLFHPIDPFAISTSRGLQLDTFISFYMQKT